MEDQRASQARMQRLARQVVSAQEEERQRISRILHDESGQALTALKISLELIAQDLPPELDSAGQRILDAATLTDETLERIRLMAQDLRPPSLDTIGLSPTLESFCQDFARRTQISIDYQGRDIPLLPEPVSITMYRFLQEGLTNVARHASADSIRVSLGRNAQGLTLRVHDNGVGFELGADGSPAKPRTSMGLESMRERLESLGGTLDIESQPGDGTRLRAFIPIREAE
jgi:signal transduction histidine kinase